MTLAVCPFDLQHPGLSNAPHKKKPECELVGLTCKAPGHLQARLGASASDYQAQYPYMFPPGIYDVPPTVDPGPGIPNGGVAYHSYTVSGRR